MNPTIKVSSNSFVLIFKTPSMSVDSFIPLPIVEHGTEFVQFEVGPGSITGQVKSFAIHSNLLIATSKKLTQRLLEHNQALKRRLIDDQIFRILGVEPAVFQIFYNWLYTISILDQPTKPYLPFASDHFWALVFELGEQFGTSALQINAFQRFRACFIPRPYSLLIEERQYIPSQDLLNMLFQPQAKPSIFQNWVVEHLTWHIDNASPKLVGVEDVLNQYSILKSYLGQAMLDSKYFPMRCRTPVL